MPCPDLNDWAPGSCARINIARLLDHYDHLRRRERLINILCELDKPAGKS